MFYEKDKTCSVYSEERNQLTIIPSKMPTAPKSASLKVVFAKPKSPNTGSKNTGKKVINKPCANAPNMAPRRPPVALPNTPAAAPTKKCGTTPGMIIVSPIR